MQVSILDFEASDLYAVLVVDNIALDANISAWLEEKLRISWVILL